MTYSNSLKNYLFQRVRSAYPEWINGGELERFALNEKYKASNASRRMRELYQAGLLERRINPENKSVEYRWLPPPKKERSEEERELLSAALL